MLEQDSEITWQISDRFQPEFPLGLLPDRAFETLMKQGGRVFILDRIY
jgi:hypothetical protein